MARSARVDKLGTDWASVLMGLGIGLTVALQLTTMKRADFRDVCVRKGIKHEYHEYPGEGHGFRKAENQIHCIEHELNFYGEVIGFIPNF